MQRAKHELHVTECSTCTRIYFRGVLYPYDVVCDCGNVFQVPPTRPNDAKPE